jgi:hypothetical protein
MGKSFTFPSSLFVCRSDRSRFNPSPNMLIGAIRRGCVCFSFFLKTFSRLDFIDDVRSVVWHSTQNNVYPKMLSDVPYCFCR